MSVPFKTALVGSRACPISITPSSSSRPRAASSTAAASSGCSAAATPRPCATPSPPTATPTAASATALEPDGRTPGTQPAATEQALRILDQADAWDDELARGACDQLQAAAPHEGGAIFVAANVEGWPHAPWWQPQEGFSLISTGQILGSLLGPRRRATRGWTARPS